MYLHHGSHLREQFFEKIGAQDSDKHRVSLKVDTREPKRTLYRFKARLFVAPGKAFSLKAKGVFRIETISGKGNELIITGSIYLLNYVTPQL